jgi:hypothetical protein
MRWIQSAIREGGGRSPAEEWAREKLESDRRSHPSASCPWSSAQRTAPVSGVGHEGEGVAEALIFTLRTSQQEQSASVEAQSCDSQQHAAWISPSMRQA